MPGPRPILRTVPTLALLAVWVCAAARADLVYLKNGRQIRGEVVSEDAEQVVVKTAEGRVTLPAREVERVEREPRAKRLLGEAREAARRGDRPLARRLYGQALEAARAAQDGPTTNAAQAELEALEAAPDPEPAGPGRRVVTRLRPGEDPFQEEERQALVRELEAALPQHPELRGQLLSALASRAAARHRQGECRLAVSDWRRAAAVAGEADRNYAPLQLEEQRCRLEVAGRALRSADALLAAAAAEPVRAATHEPFRRRACYLHGRALELSGQQREARQAFLDAVQPARLPEGHDLAILRELARLHTGGIPVGPDSPGVAEGWKRTTTPAFELIWLPQAGEAHTAGTELGALLEQALARVLERLSLPSPRERGRVAVFMLPTVEAYRASPGASSWSAGHAARLRTEDEVIRTIYLFPGAGLEDRARHEIAHIVVGDAIDDAPLPAWANEGAAIWAEGDQSRAQRRQVWQALRAQGQLEPLRAAVNKMLPPLGSDTNEVLRFYTQAAVTFEAIAAAAGPERALRALTRVNDEGADRTLAGLGVGLDRLEQSLEDLARGR